MAGGRKIKLYLNAEANTKLEELAQKLGSKSEAVRQAIELLHKLLVEGECVCPEHNA